ncbi:unnamed protein product, partial [Iphiclides podalirius]
MIISCKSLIREEAHKAGAFVETAKKLTKPPTRQRYLAICKKPPAPTAKYSSTKYIFKIHDRFTWPVYELITVRLPSSPCPSVRYIKAPTPSQATRTSTEVRRSACESSIFFFMYAPRAREAAAGPRPRGGSAWGAGRGDAAAA